MEKLHAARPSRAHRKLFPRPESADLPSGLNQWMLKVLLVPLLLQGLLEAPRRLYRYASQLAE
jgi:hypothetical protein